MIVNKSGCKINKYWDPGRNVKTLVLKIDREYEKNLLKFFQKQLNSDLEQMEK